MGSLENQQTPGGGKIPIDETAERLQYITGKDRAIGNKERNGTSKPSEENRFDKPSEKNRFNLFNYIKNNSKRLALSIMKLIDKPTASTAKDRLLAVKEESQVDEHTSMLLELIALNPSRAEDLNKLLADYQESSQPVELQPATENLEKELITEKMFAGLNSNTGQAVSYEGIDTRHQTKMRHQVEQVGKEQQMTIALIKKKLKGIPSWVPNGNAIETIRQRIDNLTKNHSAESIDQLHKDLDQKLNSIKPLLDIASRIEQKLLIDPENIVLQTLLSEVKKITTTDSGQIDIFVNTFNEKFKKNKVNQASFERGSDELSLDKLKERATNLTKKYPQKTDFINELVTKIGEKPSPEELTGLNNQLDLVIRAEASRKAQEKEDELTKVRDTADIHSQYHKDEIQQAEKARSLLVEQIANLKKDPSKADPKVALSALKTELELSRKQITNSKDQQKLTKYFLKEFKALKNRHKTLTLDEDLLSKIKRYYEESLISIDTKKPLGKSWARHRLDLFLEKAGIASPNIEVEFVETITIPSYPKKTNSRNTTKPLTALGNDQIPSGPKDNLIEMVMEKAGY